MSVEYDKIIQDMINQKQKLTLKTIKQIQQLYVDNAHRICVSMVNGTPMGPANKAWLSTWNRQIKNELKEFNDQVLKTTQSSMEKVQALVNASHKKVMQNILSYAGLKDVPDDVVQGLTHSNTDIIQRLLNGKMYKDGVGLSQRIWNNTQGMSKDINYILAQGVMQKKSAKELSKDLDMYLNPTAKKDMAWKKVYPHVGRQKVDFNSQRLARTGINHAYYLSNISTCEDNPFTQTMHWRLSASHFERQVARHGEDICDRYAHQDDYKLGQGNFPIGNVPVPHPQCMCTQYPYMPDSFEDMGNRIGDWVKGKEDPDLDEWAKKQGFDPKSILKPHEYNFDSMEKEFFRVGAEEDWFDIHRKINKSPEFIKDIYEKHQGDLKFNEAFSNDSQSFYSPRNGGITLNLNNDSDNVRGEYSTFFHEFGHCIDHRLGFISRDSRFIEAIRTDYQSKLSSFSDDVPTSKIRRQITNELRKEGDLASGVHDIYSGLSLNKICPKWGHDTDYWLREDTDKEIASEAFAHMSSSYTNTKRMEIMKKWFPTACDMFETLIKESLTK
jgi:hypothetical protein